MRCRVAPDIDPGVLYFFENLSPPYVLRTVAMCKSEWTARRPGAMLAATREEQARTRLFRMAVAAHEGSQGGSQGEGRQAAERPAPLAARRAAAEIGCSTHPRNKNPRFSVELSWGLRLVIGHDRVGKPVAAVSMLARG